MTEETGTERSRSRDGADVGRANRRVRALIEGIRSAALRGAVSALTLEPALFYGAARSRPADRRSLLREFVRRGWLEERAPLRELFPDGGASSFDRAPGGGEGSHHAYSGGLAVHLAAGGDVAFSLAGIYRKTYGIRFDPDTTLAGWLLHDHMKPVVLHRKRGAPIAGEHRIAGTRAHHVLGIANLIALELPREVILSAASAHTHPAEDGARVAGFLEAASLLAGADPVRRGLLERGGSRPALRVSRPFPPESFLVHLADRDWPFTTWLAGPGRRAG